MNNKRSTKHITLGLIVLLMLLFSVGYLGSKITKPSYASQMPSAKDILKITKVWENDTEEQRPDDVTIHFDIIEGRSFDISTGSFTQMIYNSNLPPYDNNVGFYVDTNSLESFITSWLRENNYLGDFFRDYDPSKYTYTNCDLLVTRSVMSDSTSVLDFNEATTPFHIIDDDKRSNCIQVAIKEVMNFHHTSNSSYLEYGFIYLNIDENGKVIGEIKFEPNFDDSINKSDDLASAYYKKIISDHYQSLVGNWFVYKHPGCLKIDGNNCDNTYYHLWPEPKDLNKPDSNGYIWTYPMFRYYIHIFEYKDVVVDGYISDPQWWLKPGDLDLTNSENSEVPVPENTWKLDHNFPSWTLGRIKIWEEVPEGYESNATEENPIIIYLREEFDFETGESFFKPQEITIINTLKENPEEPTESIDQPKTPSEPENKTIEPKIDKDNTAEKKIQKAENSDVKTGILTHINTYVLLIGTIVFIIGFAFFIKMSNKNNSM